MRALTIAGAGPGRRAAALAAGTARWLPAALTGYDQLFAAAGLPPDRVRRLALAARDALHDWAPDLGAELDGYARAADLPPWRLHAVNARTELLAAAGAASRGECSTVAGPLTDGSTIGAQTWDWHQHLAGSWAVLSYPDASCADAGRYPFVTLTEAGMLAKIGMNAAGVGLLFNILCHRTDTGTGGVPVHALARRILDSAGDLDAAISILRGAPLAASSCFTLLDPARVRCFEAAPAGVVEVPATAGPNGWTVHTNDFLNPALAAGGRSLSAESDSEPRRRLLAGRLADTGAPRPADLSGLAGLLCAHEPDGAAVCCHPAAAAPLGSRWQTLATVGLEPAAGRMSVLAGGPCELARSGWQVFSSRQRPG